MCAFLLVLESMSLHLLRPFCSKYLFLKKIKIKNSLLRCGWAVPRLWIPSDSQLTVCDSCEKVLFRRPADMLINFRCAGPDWLVVRVRDVRAARLFKLIRCVRSKKAAHQSAACDARELHSLSRSRLSFFFFSSLSACAMSSRRNCKVLNVWNTKPPNFTCWERTPLLVHAALLRLCNRLWKEKKKLFCKSAAAKRTAILFSFFFFFF